MLHDLNSPLSSIKLSAATLKDFSNRLDESKRDEIIDRIETLGSYSTKLIENQNDWINQRSETITFEPEPIGLIDFVNELTLQHKVHTSLKNIKIELDLHDIIIESDKFILEIIIRNILSNSIKFTTANGLIIIRTKFYSENLFLEVEDNGIGVSDKVIESFESAEKMESQDGTNNEKGNGIGLVIIRDFLKLIGSEYKLEKKKKGTLFRFSLKISEI